MAARILAVLILIIALAATVFIFSHRQAAAPATLGAYGYTCANGAGFTMLPSSNMSTIQIVPTTQSGASAPTTLTYVPTSSGATYVGGGITFHAVGEGVTLTDGTSSVTCSPLQVPNEAPYNFGD